MAPTLCETFRALAFHTHNQLSKSQAVGHQPLEETFSNTNILELKVKHPGEIYSHTFTKPQEGLSGADWEWWLTNKSRTSWLGLRVQAKVLELRSDTFPHLHYASGNPKTYQLQRLQSEAFKAGMVPLYCFYTLLSLRVRLPNTIATHIHLRPSSGTARWLLRSTWRSFRLHIARTMYVPSFRARCLGIA